MDRREAPPTAEGWYALHDFRRVVWDKWCRVPDRQRVRAIEEGRKFLEAAAGVEDAPAGASATYAVIGHKADLLLVHLRPTLDDLDALERQFERTALAGFMEQPTSYLSVTEVSGYTEGAQPFFEGGEVEDQGLANYIETRLHPKLPAADYVSFYPMSKRREGDDNWYDLPLDERAGHVGRHGEIGREYAGRVTQVVTGSVGLDDYEWGVTLFANDLLDVKRLLYEMRFDPSTSRFAEFGPFYVGRRLRPDKLEAYLEGERLDEVDEPVGTNTAGTEVSDDAAGSIREELTEQGVYAGQPHGEDVHALVLYSEADPEELFEAVEGLRGNFDHYDTHVRTAVYAERGGDRTAVASLWETQGTAEVAAGYLSDLPGVIGRAGEDAGFATMGLFYTAKPEHREEFVEAFDDVEELLEGMEGHRETRLFVNHEDGNDTFISSRWRERDDAMTFFRSDAFRDTVSWGREVLADRPRHVFLA